MGKIIFGDFVEYNSPSARLGNYHYCNCYLKDGFEALWMANSFNHLVYFKNKENYQYRRSISTVKRHPLRENLYTFAPYAWRLYGNYPFCRSASILENFEKYIIPDIAKSLRKLDFMEVDVLWLSHPKMFYLTKIVKYDKFIYRMADDYSKFNEFPNIAGIDEALIKKADQVVIASSMFAQHVLERGKTPLLLNNGVDFEHFNRPQPVCPSEYKENGRKRVIYVGALKYWFDLELMVKLAWQVDADIYIIGQCETDLSALQKCANVHILGARNYEVLPAYLQHADVALVPFVKSEATDGIAPIKLYEYCAAGVAVVSTNLRETINQNPPIWIADSHEAFIAGVKHYLNNGYDRQALIDFGKNNTWQQRYEFIKEKMLTEI